MHHTIELLVNGNKEVSEYYRSAVARWREIWKRPESKDVTELAELLSSEQMWFDRNCGPLDNPWVGQEIMVVAGFGMLYNTDAGFNGNLGEARLLYDAFQRSYCDIEVKAIARDVAASYDIIEGQVA
jgi:hypothetical protein